MKSAEKSVPELRFAGFDNQWSSKRFNDVLILKSRPFKMDDESEYSLVTVKRRYGGVVLRGIYRGKEIKVKSQFELKENDFIISKRQIVHNACGIVPENLSGSIVSNEYSVFKPKSNLDIAYFNYFCHQPKISHTFYLSSIGVHIEKMLFKVDDWLKRQFYFPALPEQQKIASFLSAVDKKIEKLTRKKELLETYKKGVMQKIFSREIRFKDENGKGYPDWEEKRLGEIGAFKNGINKNKKDFGFGSNFVNLMDVFGKNSIENGMFGKVNANKKELVAYNLKKGDVLFIRSSVKRTGTGEAALIMEDFDNTVYSGFLIRFRDVQQSFVLEFKKYCFAIPSFRKELLSYATTSANTNINQESLVKLKVSIPCLKEQKRIANFLSDIDKKLDAVQTQLTQTQEFKKGLLQKMFV